MKNSELIHLNNFNDSLKKITINTEKVHQNLLEKIHEQNVTER